jgi:protease-4
MYGPAPRQGGGWTRAIFVIFVTLATTIFGLSLTLNFYLLVYTGLFSGDDVGSVSTTIVEEGDVGQTIAVVPVEGVIDHLTYERFDRWMRVVEKDQNVKALVVDLDTPGGEVTASDQIYERVRKFRAEKKIPVVAVMQSAAASGGYYIACAADHIVAHPTTITGSIGVRWDRIKLARLADKYGVDDASIHATGAPLKVADSMLKPDTPELIAYLTTIVDDAFARFKQVVRDGRKLSTEEVDAVANGKIYTAQQALPLKLIDAVGYSRDAYGKAASMAGLSNPRVVRYRAVPSFFDAFAVRASSTRTPGGETKLDRGVLDKLTAPRLLYHWNGN